MSSTAGKLVASIVIVVALSACDGGGGLTAKVGVGDPAPKSENRVALREDDWHEVSTMDTKVRLYRWRISDLIAQHKPFLVVFGTPQHCTMCVDQLTRVAVLEEKFGERFAFVHVDGYKDNAVWVEWGIKGEPWTFLIDAKGVVRKVFPGQTEISLIEGEIETLLGEAA
jgi:hypothetical protein